MSGNATDMSNYCVRSNVLKAKAERQLIAKNYVGARRYLMGCINGVIECSRQLKEYDTALLWLAEADILNKNLEISGQWVFGQLCVEPSGISKLTAFQNGSGHLYVLGGEKFNEVWFRDFWMLDLEKLDVVVGNTRCHQFCPTVKMPSCRAFD
ncbi:hypothetical protein B0H16DRAFT_1477871 [Mycena metata]|uniref:Uncharacterized protein n=1 Tax=Mycena metata TaxID=1033252 RepID=A0AAD7H8K9_9AGAR|nr:hypothetical protein B0H16DRAFT_1477871 [Mycena metata]